MLGAASFVLCHPPHRISSHLSQRLLLIIAAVCCERCHEMVQMAEVMRTFLEGDGSGESR